MTSISAPCAASTLIPRDLFANSLSRFGDHTAVKSPTGALTYRELDEAATRLASGLTALGVQPGTPVAIILPNCAEFLITDLAIFRLGAIKIPVNPGLTTSEAGFILDDSGALVAITDSRHADAALHDPRRRVVTVRCDLPGTTNWSSLLQASPVALPSPGVIDPGAPAVIYYTGGTTGRSKGVVHTQAALGANLVAQLLEIGLQDDERVLLSTPLAHAAGAIAIIGLLKGATIYLEDGFDAFRVRTLLATEGITFAFMVPTMIYRLLDEISEHESSAFKLRTLLYGAAPMDPVRLQRGLSLWGPVFMQLYGQTEAPNFITRLTREDHTNPALLRSSGRAAALMDVKVLDANGEPVASGTPGEVCTRGPYLMSGYHGLPEQTAEVLYDGWLHTGDIGYLDDNDYLFLLARKKDIIISGGMNVYSAEVEDVLRECSGVAEVAVIGLPDHYWGEAVIAVIVVGNDLFDRATAIDHCRRRLAGYKRPKRYVEVSDLPLTSLGKVDKPALRQQVIDVSTDVSLSHGTSDHEESGLQ